MPQREIDWIQSTSKIADNGVIRSIDLSKFYLKNITDNIFLDLSHRDKISAIRMNDCSMSELTPGCFDHLINLQMLSLKNNRLKSIPNGVFGNLRKLEWLSLTNNFLNQIPRDIMSLPILRSLGLEHNKLPVIRLNQTYISNEDIKTIPEQYRND